MLCISFECYAFALNVMHLRLDEQCYAKDSFRLTKEVINFNAMHILNSFRVRSFFSNFFYTFKELRRVTSNRLKNEWR